MKKHKITIIIISGLVAVMVIVLLLIFVPIDNRTEYVCSNQVSPGAKQVSYTYHWFSKQGVNDWDNKLSETGPGRLGCDIPAHIKLYML